MATYSDVLRKKSTSRGLRESSKMWQDYAGQSGGPTIGGGMVEGMRGVMSPTAMSVNTAGILQRQLGNFMSQYEASKADKADVEGQQATDEIVNGLMQNDPQAQRLYQMAQVGVPGADKALGEYINPKKEAMGAFLQYIQSGVADAESIGPVAERFGIDAETGKRMAATAMQRRQDALREGRSWDLNADLLKQENAAALRSAGKQATGPGGMPVMQLTPGQKQLQGKMMAELDKSLMEIGQDETKFPEMMAAIERDDSFGPAGKVSEWLSGSPNRLISGVGRGMQSEGNLMLNEYMNSKVLARMKLLGGNDSNEELNRITASLPNALNEKGAAKAMLEHLHRWEKTTRLAIKMRRDDIQTGRWFSNQPSEDDYYNRAKAVIGGGADPSPAQKGPVPAGIPTEQINSIELMLDDLGLQ